MKVLIIDDEPNVREGLKIIVPWEKHGFTVCGDAVDGIDGLQKIILLEPDLVLIDIRMPGMMGIAVIEEAQKRGFKGKFIITTGYSEFEYAKKAISLGVSSYVLKPIDEDELILEVDKLAKEIHDEKEIKGKVSLGESFLHSQVLLKALTTNPQELGDVSPEQYTQLEIKYGQYYLAILDIEVPLSRRADIVEKITAYVSTYEGIELVQINNEIVFIMTEGKIEVQKEALVNLHNKLMSRYQVKNTVAFSGEIMGFESMPAAYKRLKALIEKHFLLPQKLIWEEEEVEKTEEVIHIDAESISAQLYSLLQVGDKERLKEELKSIKETLVASRVNVHRTMGLLINILIKCLDHIRHQYAQYEISVPNGDLIIEEIYKCVDIDEVIAYMEKELISLSEQIEREAPENTMDKILYYIRTNYNKELRLELLAELFNYNSAYLGKSFKNYTGESFNVYIDKLRINKAKELLLNKDMRVYQISKQVGYKHIDYFHSKFKKYVGLSPLEYRKSKGETGADEEI